MTPLQFPPCTRQMPPCKQRKIIGVGRLRLDADVILLLSTDKEQVRLQAGFNLLAYRTVNHFGQGRIVPWLLAAADKQQQYILYAEGEARLEDSLLPMPRMLIHMKLQISQQHSREAVNQKRLLSLDRRSHRAPSCTAHLRGTESWECLSLLSAASLLPNTGNHQAHERLQSRS